MQGKSFFLNIFPTEARVLLPNDIWWWPYWIFNLHRKNKTCKILKQSVTRHFIRNKQNLKTSSNWTKNKRSTYKNRRHMISETDIFGPLVSFVYFWSTKKHRFDLDNEHSYPLWFQLAQCIQWRRFKYKSLQMMTTDDNRHQVMTISQMTVWIRWTKNLLKRMQDIISIDWRP